MYDTDQRHAGCPNRNQFTVFRHSRQRDQTTQQGYYRCQIKGALGHGKGDETHCVRDPVSAIDMIQFFYQREQAEQGHQDDQDQTSLSTAIGKCNDRGKSCIFLPLP